ncbi:tetratricopeptide repeat protein [Actinomadura verrucosospora]|uniref:SARP family transcription regulator n=1 Tax=Actinomadura verrucosospora TaxID=46165 RepID=A0A7D3ZZC2_ACTVE|nr:tetratricopeptide repeat protein [Actinomadura verrucosospora]QKG22024.1 SARP family transcription regulator [Actinomadura verrucosospora]
MTTELGGASIEGDLVSGDKIVHLRPAPEAEPPPRQLPPDVPGFTGRREILADLDRLVAGQGTTPVIIALSGMPGIGKTALAVHWAHLRSGRFPDGQLFIDLRGYSKRGALSPREALGQALRTLRVPVSRLPADEDELAAVYRSRLAGRRVLIVLDDAASAQQVYPLLPGTPSCVVVVTARRTLAGLVARYGARATTLDLLRDAEALDLIGEVAGPERARREPKAAAELVRVCARLPLALRVAAANLATRPQQTVAETVEALSDGDRLSKLALSEDPREAVGATFDLSYRGLDTETRRTFRLLGLVEGPNVAPEAVGALLGTTPEAARRLLDQLETAGLVQSIGGGRHRLHELLREYAHGRARREDSAIVREAAIQRFATWYLTAAQQAGRFLDRYRRTIRQELTAPPVNPDPAERARHLDWFALEQPNLTEITRQVARLHWDQLTWELADAVHDFYELRRYCHENLEAHRLGLAAAERAGNTPACFFMHHHLSVTHRELGQAQEALTEAEHALALSIRLGDRYGEAAVRDNMARTHVQLSNYKTALELGKQALAMRREISDRHAEAATLDTLARGYRGLSEYRKGYECAANALQIRKEIGDLRGEAETLDYMARIYYARGRLAESLEATARALRIRKEIGDRHGEGETLAFLGYLNMRIGHHLQAREHAEQALAIRRQINDRQGEGQALVYLSTIRRRLGRHEEAVQAGLEALDIVQELGDRHQEAEALETLSRCYRRMREYRRARLDAERALAVRREIGDRHGEANTLNALGLIDLNDGRLARACTSAKRSLRLCHVIGDKRGIASSLDLLSKVYLKMGRAEKALNTASRSLDLGMEIDHQYGQAVTLRALGEILWRLGRLPDAIATVERARETAMRIGDEHGAVKTLELQARIYRDAGDPVLSQATQAEADDLAARLAKV